MGVTSQTDFANRCRSPEAANRISYASDVWSLAATIFHIYTGLGAFLPHNTDVLMPTCIPWSLQRLLGKCFDLFPSDRPNAVELVTELQVGPD